MADINCPNCSKPTDIDPYDWGWLNRDTYTCKHCGAVLNVDSSSYWDEDEQNSYQTFTLTVKTPP